MAPTTRGTSRLCSTTTRTTATLFQCFMIYMDYVTLNQIDEAYRDCLKHKRNKKKCCGIFFQLSSKQLQFMERSQQWNL